LPQSLRQLLGVLMRAILLCLLGLPFLSEDLQFAAGRLDGEALREKVVARVAVGNVLDLTGPP